MLKYLIDTSALVRIWRNQVDPAWLEVASSGVIAVCEPVLAEMLVSADAEQYKVLERKIRRTYPYITVPDSVWDGVHDIRHQLVLRSAHKGPSVVDMIVAWTAIRTQLTVLHEDRDFETVARCLPHLEQQRINEKSKSQ